MMFERFTDRARRVLVLAQEEARLLEHNFIGTEHILLGLVHEGESVAAQALQALGISLAAVREKVAETIGPATGAPAAAPPFTPRAKKVLELSLREALQLGHNHIGTEHLLLGLVCEGEGVAAQVLIELSGSLSQVRDEVMRLLGGGASDRPSLSRTREPRGTLARSSGSPECPGCRISLTDTLRWSTIAVPGRSGEREGLRHAVVWWCRACGRTISITPQLAPDQEAPGPTGGQRGSTEPETEPAGAAPAEPEPEPTGP
jgi:ATP-dependent Clp protease ATP-binding subunit ClpC